MSWHYGSYSCYLLSPPLSVSDGNGPWDCCGRCSLSPLRVLQFPKNKFTCVLRWAPCIQFIQPEHRELRGG